MKSLLAISAAIVALGLATAAKASTYRVLLESNAGALPGAEVFQVTFDTLPDLIAGDFSDSGFSEFGINDLFSIGGFAHDGKYRVLLESNAGALPGAEVFQVTFDTFEDLIAGDFSDSGFSEFGINDLFSIGGFAYDGKYRVLLESNAGALPGAEVFQVTFDTFEDLIAGDFSDSGFSEFGINDLFSIGGFAYDGKYRVLLESNAGALPGAEVFQVTFDTFEDLIAGDFSDSGFSEFGINDLFSIGGVAYDGPLTGDTDPSPIPLPASLPVLAVALCTLFGLRSRT